MTSSGNISFMAQMNAQVNRLTALRAQMDDLGRQSTTQKKYDTYSGFGPSALDLQRLHTGKTMIQGYLENIEKLSTRLTLQSNSMSQIQTVGQQLLKSISLQTVGDASSQLNIKNQAASGLTFIQDLLNQTLDGRYIFAGSNVTNPPFIDDSGMNSNFINQINDWLSGAQTTQQLLTTTNAFSDAQLGLSPTLATDGNVTSRIDDNLDIDYTVKADQSGFQKVLNAFGMMANLTYPGATDVPTYANFQTVVQNIVEQLTEGLEEIKASQTQLTNKFNLVNYVKEAHTSELGIVTVKIDEMENVDAATAITSLQALQTQLTASYQVTRIVSQMSLVNFL